MSNMIYASIIITVVFALISTYQSKLAYRKGAAAGIKAGFSAGVALERSASAHFTKLADSLDKNAKTPSEAIINSEYYAKLGQMGISPHKVAELNESIAKLQAFEAKWKKDREDAETK